MFFSKKEAPKEIQKPEPVQEPVQEPEVNEDNVIVVETKDTVNDGDPRNPDWTYLFDTCKIDIESLPEVEMWCDKISENKQRYEEVARSVMCPWYLVPLLHIREASMRWDCALHNGDKIIGKGTKTTHVPKGRGPFDTWEDGAIDALVYDGLSNLKDWDKYKVLERAERFNGLGYRKKIGDHGVVEYTPYVWAGTNHHDETSKYTSDHGYDKNAKERQLGVAAILKRLEQRGHLD